MDIRAFFGGKAKTKARGKEVPADKKSKTKPLAPGPSSLPKTKAAPPPKKKASAAAAAASPKRRPQPTRESPRKRVARVSADEITAVEVRAVP